MPPCDAGIGSRPAPVEQLGAQSSKGVSSGIRPTEYARAALRLFERHGPRPVLTPASKTLNQARLDRL